MQTKEQVDLALSTLKPRILSCSNSSTNFAIMLTFLGCNSLENVFECLHMLEAQLAPWPNCSSCKLLSSCVFSFVNSLYLILHACAARIDVTKNLIFFLILGVTKQGLRSWETIFSLNVPLSQSCWTPLHIV